MAKRNRSSTEEKLLRATHSLFILEATRLGVSGADMRKILGIGMSEVTPAMKIFNRALKKLEKAKNST